MPSAPRGEPLIVAALAGAVLLALTACTSGTEVSRTSTTANAFADFRQPAAAEQAVHELLDAAGADEVLSIKVQSLAVTIEVVADSDDKAVEYSLSVTDPGVVRGPTAAGEHHWYDSPMQVSQLDWSAVLQTENDCGDPVTMVHTIGFATRQVTTSCLGQPPVTAWLSDGSPLTLDVTDPAQLQGVYGRLTSGSPGQARAVSVASGQDAQLYVTLADGQNSRILQMVDGGVGSSGESPAQSSAAFANSAFNAAGLLKCASQMADRLDQKDWKVTIQSESGSLVYRWSDEKAGASVVTTTDCQPR